METNGKNNRLKKNGDKSKMNNCKCQSCMKIPKNEDNPYCEVIEFKNKCKSIFPDWRLGLSYDAQDDTSRLYIMSSTKQLSISVEQIQQLYESGYHVLAIEVKLNNFEEFYNTEKLPFEEYPTEFNAKFKPVIYVEKMANEQK